MSVVPAQQMRLDVWAVMMRPVIMAHSYIEYGIKILLYLKDKS